MATLTKLSSGNWRIQIRRKDRYATRTFRKREDAETWGFALERQIETQLDWNKWTVKELIDLYLQDMLEAGRPVGRTRQSFLESIRPSLGKLPISQLNRETFIEYGRTRAKDGACPGTVNHNFSDLRAVLTYLEAAHKVPFRHDEFEYAHIVLRKLGLMRKNRLRSRRPTTDEIQQLIDFFANSPRQFIPMDRVIQFNRDCNAPRRNLPHRMD